VQAYARHHQPNVSGDGRQSLIERPLSPGETPDLGGGGNGTQAHFAAHQHALRTLAESAQGFHQRVAQVLPGLHAGEEPEVQAVHQHVSALARGLLQGLGQFQARFPHGGQWIALQAMGQDLGAEGRIARPAGSAQKVARIAVEKQQRRVLAFDPDGRLVASYPASIGSGDKPTPSGLFTITKVARLPVWRYNPRFAFKEVKGGRAFNVAAGPNSPLGTVWIGLTAPSYGIHGTALPEEVGVADSHGCVRLTNWDVQALAAMVQKGATVEFIE